MRRLRLGVNVDHVATLRNARGGSHPCPVRAARMAERAGADGITAHLREDRRHITDEDVARLAAECTRPLNLEIAASPEMVEIARRTAPHACCIVPERRAERTTERGLDAVRNQEQLAEITVNLRDAGTRVSLFIDPDPLQLDAAVRIGVPVIELHTGSYCEARGDRRQAEFERLRAAARYAKNLGLECHAGHGLDYETAAAIATIPELVEFNIGHFLVGEAVFEGMEPVIRRMRQVMDDAASGSRPQEP